MASHHRSQSHCCDKDTGGAPDSFLLIRGACPVRDIYGIAVGVLAPQVEAHVVNLRPVFGEGLARIRAALGNRGAGGQGRCRGDGPDVGIVGCEGEFQRLGKIQYISHFDVDAERGPLGINELADFQLPEVGVGRHLDHYGLVCQTDVTGYLALDFERTDTCHDFFVHEVVPLLGAGS